MKSFVIIVSAIQLMYAQVSVIEDSLFSPSINAMTTFNVILPDGYQKGHERYPVLYLLHGFSGDFSNWVKLTNLVKYAKEYRFIIIMPDGKNSWYTNAAALPNAGYEDLVMKDIIPIAEKKYRVIQSKYNRAIAGLSMGGYGAIKFGLKYPSKFYFVGGLSPAIQFPAGLEDSVIVARRSKESNHSVRNAFGAVRSDSWNDNDVFLLTAKANPKTLPYFYLSVGSQDGIPEIIDLTHSFAAALRKLGAPFEMHETAGGHDWQFWDKEIEIILRRMSEIQGKKK